MERDEETSSLDNYLGVNDMGMTSHRETNSMEEKILKGDVFKEDVGKSASCMNGDINSLDKSNLKESEKKVNGEALVDDVEQICLSGEEEEKR